jgi:hypothetical protein
MPVSPVPADPGWDEDLGWLDRDPERECWLDRAREHDEPLESGEEYDPDRPAGHPDPPGRPARRAIRPRPGRPLADPRPGRRRRGQPQDHLKPHRHRRPGPRHRPRLRPPPNPGVTGNAPAPGPPAFSFTPASRDGPPGGYGAWRLRTPGPGPDLIITLDPVTTDPCNHQHEAKGHDPGARLRHLAQVRYATCTSPVCRRPAARCDHEHNIP